MDINESKQLYDNFVRMVLEAIRKDDFEFIESSIEQYPEIMVNIADELKLLTKAFTSGSVQAFKVLVSKLDFSDRTSQLSDIEQIIKQRLRSITEADEHNVCDGLDMIVEFSSVELEQEIYEITKNSIDVSIHILLFRALLRNEGIDPYEYLEIAETKREKEFCMELMAV
jgi:hypothetical protein